MQRYPLLAIVIFIMLTAGCLQSTEGLEDIQIEETKNPTIYFANHSHQYDNALPMGQGNQTDLVLNNTTQMHIEISSRFHEPLAWEQGYLNVTLSGNNYTWSYQTSETDVVNMTVWFNQSGNYSLTIMSEGSDDQTDNLPGDAYIIYARFETW